MKLKKLMQYGQNLLVVAVALVLSACGSEKKSSSRSYGVYGPAANGYYGNMYMANNDAGYLGDNFAWRNFTVTDSATFTNFIKKVHGVCDQAYYSGGINSCSSWSSSYFRIIYQASSVSPALSRVMFMTYPQTNSYYWFGYQLPSWEQFFQGLMGFPIPQAYGNVRNPIALDMTVSNINKSAGFEARSYGAWDTLANKSLIQFQVATGKVFDNQITFTLSFEGRPFASGSLYRCTRADCR